MTVLTRSESERDIQRVTWLGMAMNVGLTLIKAGVGWWAGSVALIADALHSLSDLATDFVVLVGVRLASRPPDESHPYGHGKLETLATFLIALILISSGAGIVWKSVLLLSTPQNHQMGWAILGPALLSVVSKEWLYHQTLTVSKRTKSSSTYANAWHHRTDSFSSLVVLIGAGAILLGWPFGDQTAGIIVGLMVVYAGIHILLQCLNELGEGAVDRTIRERLNTILSAQTHIASWHRLRARKAGREIIMDVHVLVDPRLSVLEGHNISRELEAAVRDGLDQPVSITIHIEPNIPSEKKEAQGL